MDEVLDGCREVLQDFVGYAILASCPILIEAFHHPDVGLEGEMVIEWLVGVASAFQVEAVKRVDGNWGAPRERTSSVCWHFWALEDHVV